MSAPKPPKTKKAAKAARKLGKQSSQHEMDKKSAAMEQDFLAEEEAKKTNPFQQIASETRASVADILAPLVDRRDLPETLAVDDWFVNHEKKRVVGQVKQLMSKQCAVTLQNYLGIRSVFQYSFLFKNGYVHEKTDKIAALAASGYTNTMDIKREWVTPREPAPMTEEAKARLRELGAKKKADRTLIPAKEPKPPKDPKSVKPCLCGCDRTTLSFFAPGHDVKFKKLVNDPASKLTPAQRDHALSRPYFSDDVKARIR